MLPTFIVIGAMKAGTTALYGYLAAHPAVFMADPKEINFFGGHNEGRGRAWYEAHFDASGDAVARGEASPNYTKVHIMPDSAERMAAMIPDVRLVYLMRHPVERMRSMYLHQIADVGEPRPIDMAFRRNRDYLRTSMYGMQVAAYRRWFSPDQILLEKSEDLLADRAGTLARIYSHVGVDPLFLPTELTPNRAEARRFPSPVGSRLIQRSAYRRLLDRSWRVREAHNRWLTKAHDPAVGEIPPDLEAEMIEQLIPDLERLSRFAGDDFDCWGLA